MAEITLVKSSNDVWTPATETDRDYGKPFKLGKGIKVTAVQLSARSLQHHKLYWGGLIELGLHYWEPDIELVTDAEKRTLGMFSNWLDSQGGNTGAIRNAQKIFLSELSKSRADNVPVLNKDPKAFHEWIKEKAGFFEWVPTPTGIRKQLKSINFNAMKKEEFEDYYKKAFSVVWKFVLSRTFNSEEESQRAIDQLIAMG
jgi:hypothetical protein